MSGLSTLGQGNSASSGATQGGDRTSQGNEVQFGGINIGSQGGIGFPTVAVISVVSAIGLFLVLRRKK